MRCGTAFDFANHATQENDDATDALFEDEVTEEHKGGEEPAVEAEASTNVRLIF